MGPKLNAGKNVKAPTMMITLTRSAVNNGVVTGNVPGEGGTAFLRARLPATANMGTISESRTTFLRCEHGESLAMVYHVRTGRTLLPSEDRAMLAVAGSLARKKAVHLRRAHSR